MLQVGQWIESRLARMEATHFGQASHRKTPDSCAQIANIEYFLVPLASGMGTSVFASPKDSIYSKGVLLVLLHGLGDDCTFPFWHWIEQFVKEGFSVLSYDWDGHGSHNSSFLDFQVSTRSVHLLLQKLYGTNSEFPLERKDNPPCYLVGFSEGGALALLAASFPDLQPVLNGVAVISPTITMAQPKNPRKELLQYVFPTRWSFKPIAQVGFQTVWKTFFSHKKEEFPLRLKTGINSEVQMRQFAEETFEKRRVLKNVRVPVLWMHGEKDTIVPIERAEKLMLEMPTALFSHFDSYRGHVRMALSKRIPEYISTFINRIHDRV